MRDIIQCTPLLVEKACVAPEGTLGFTTHMQVSVQAREPPWLSNLWGGVTRSPKQGQSVATRHGPWSNKNLKLKDLQRQSGQTEWYACGIQTTIEPCCTWMIFDLIKSGLDNFADLF